MHGLENEYQEQIEFVYLDIDDPDTAEAKEKYGYRYQPHFFLVDGNGEVVQQWLGPVQESEFRRAFNEVLSN